MKMGIRDVKAVTFAGSIYMQRAKHKLPKQQENTNIKIPLSFLCCFFYLVLFWTSHLLKEKVATIYY